MSANKLARITHTPAAPLGFATWFTPISSPSAPMVQLTFRRVDAGPVTLEVEPSTTFGEIKTRMEV